MDPDMPMEMDIMTMYFYQTTKVKFLFERFDVTSDSGYAGVIIVSFIIGFITETLSIA